MDPDANIAAQCRIRRRIADRKTMKGDYGRLRELKEALAGWRRGGGFAPKGGWRVRCPRR